MVSVSSTTRRVRGQQQQQQRRPPRRSSLPRGTSAAAVGSSSVRSLLLVFVVIVGAVASMTIVLPRTFGAPNVDVVFGLGRNYFLRGGSSSPVAGDLPAAEAARTSGRSEIVDDDGIVIFESVYGRGGKEDDGEVSSAPRVDVGGAEKGEREDTTSGGGGGSVAFRYASSISDRHGYVILHMFNSGFANMTKSWICNVRKKLDGGNRGRAVLDKTLFVATDRDAYDAIASFFDDAEDGGDLNVALEIFEAPDVLEFGDVTYFTYMLFRTDFILRLLENGTTVWLVEADAFWLDDPTDVVLNTEGDTVAMSDDGRRPNFMANGGFQLLRPTSATRSAWQILRSMQERDVADLRNGVVSSSSSWGKKEWMGNEQIMMHRIRNVDLKGEMKTGWLPKAKFVSGVYFEMNETDRPGSPAVILNNWLVGNDAKMKRARENGFWFLDDDGASCLEKR